MKYSITLILGLFLVILLLPQNKQLDAKPPAPRIQWITIEKAEELMKTSPKKVYVDFYTDWCHWCKVMDQKTFKNAYVASYMNEHYYAIKFNAESRKTVMFQGKEYKYNAKYRAHDLAIELLQGQLSFPTSVIMQEDFKDSQPIPGYIKVPQMEMILKYIAGNHHTKTPWDKYSKAFKNSWR